MKNKEIKILDTCSLACICNNIKKLFLATEKYRNVTTDNISQISFFSNKVLKQCFSEFPLSLKDFKLSSTIETEKVSQNCYIRTVFSEKNKIISYAFTASIAHVDITTHLVKYVSNLKLNLTSFNSYVSVYLCLSANSKKISLDIVNKGVNSTIYLYLTSTKVIEVDISILSQNFLRNSKLFLKIICETTAKTRISAIKQRIETLHDRDSRIDVKPYLISHGHKLLHLEHEYVTVLETYIKTFFLAAKGMEWLSLVGITNQF